MRGINIWAAVASAALLAVAVPRAASQVVPAMHQLASDPVLVGAGDIATVQRRPTPRPPRCSIRSTERCSPRATTRIWSAAPLISRIATSPRGGATSAARVLFPAITTTTPPALRPITRISARTPVPRDGVLQLRPRGLAHHCHQQRRGHADRGRLCAGTVAARRSGRQPHAVHARLLAPSAVQLGFPPERCAHA